MVANFSSHALLHERTELALIVDLDDLLRPIGRVGDVELHLDTFSGAARSRQRRCLSTGRSCGDGRYSRSAVRGEDFWLGLEFGVARFLCGRISHTR